MSSDITDITWLMMTQVGLDINLIGRRPTQTGEDEYIFEDGDLRVAFGPSVDMQEGGTYGWSVGTYSLSTVGVGNPHWESVREEWAETAEEALRLVVAAVTAGT